MPCGVAIPLPVETAKVRSPQQSNTLTFPPEEK